jgi:uncharacterized protein YozE (UPF0346 family)
MDVCWRFTEGSLLLRIKNWSSFQHYKNRKPPWNRLNRDLLDDDDFADLPDSAVRHLLMFWLIASEDPTLEGNLPSTKKLAYRLRTTIPKVEKSISQLSHYLEYDASTVLSTCTQHATPDAEAEAEKRQTQRQMGFDDFWSAYPKKVGKAAAKKAFAAAAKNGLPNSEALVAIIESHKQSEQWQKDNGQFIPNPSTWLNQGRWDDEVRRPGQDTLDYIAELERREREEEGIEDVEFKTI